MTPLLTLGLALLLAFVLWRVWPAPIALTFRALDRRHGRLKSCRVRTGSIDWHALEGGHGEPLVLLHGFNAHEDHFNRVARYLSRHFRVLAPDLPGFGRTDAEHEDHSLEGLADSLRALLRRLGVRRLALCVGNSLGGALACSLALDHFSESPGSAR